MMKGSGGRTESSRGSGDRPSSSARFGFIGGDPSLDFVNTVDDWLGASPSDRLDSYGDLLDWVERARLASARSIRALRAEAARSPQRAARAFETARRLRGALYRTLVAVASGGIPADEDMNTIAALGRKAAARSQLHRRAGRFVWALDEDGVTDLSWPAWRIAASAVALLTSELLRHVRQCADPTCGWLFLDRSRNHSRRWCDMSSCGNRAKARRHYARRVARRDG